MLTVQHTYKYQPQQSKDNMANQSFEEIMVIDTPEKARALRQAFLIAEARGPLTFDGPDIFDELRRTEEHLRRHPLD